MSILPDLWLTMTECSYLADPPIENGVCTQEDISLSLTLPSYPLNPNPKADHASYHSIISLHTKSQPPFSLTHRRTRIRYKWS